MSVRAEKSGPRHDGRPRRDPRAGRNAVDRDTADALAAAFEAFEQRRVGERGGPVGRGRRVLLRGRTCVAIGSRGCANRDRTADGRWPEAGPTPADGSRPKPVAAGVAGYAVAGGLELGAAGAISG